MRSIGGSWAAREAILVRASARMLAVLAAALAASGVLAADATQPAARGVVTASEPAKPVESRVAPTTAEPKETPAPDASRAAEKSPSKSTRNPRTTTKTRPNDKAVTAAGVAAAKTATVPPEPAEKPRPALVVDGTPAAPQRVAEPVRPPEIEVRVSATQRRENLYRNAVNAIIEGRTDEGVKQLQQILAEHPGQDNARQILIGVALRSKQFARAEALADDRLAHGNEHLGFAVVSARLKLDRSDPVAALDVLKRSEVHAGSSAEYQALMAAVLQRLSRHGEAAERFRAALALQPGAGIWQMGLGVSLEALERPVEAIEAFKRARDGTGLTPELRAFVDERVAELQR